MQNEQSGKPLIEGDEDQMKSKVAKLKGSLSRNASKRGIPVIKRDNLKDIQILPKHSDSPLNNHNSSNTTFINNQFEAAPTACGSNLGQLSHCDYETPARQMRAMRESNEFSSTFSQAQRHQSRGSEQTTESCRTVDIKEVHTAKKGKLEVLFEAKESQEQNLGDEKARKTVYDVSKSGHQTQILGKDSKMYMTMRAYNVKKTSRKSNSIQSNNSSSRIQDEFPSETQDDRVSNSQQINNSIQNSEKILSLMDTVGVTGQQTKLDQQMRSTSKNQQKRTQAGAAIGMNLLKFPPGFFNENQFKMMDNRLNNRKRQKESQDSSPYSLQRENSNQSLSKQLESSSSKDKFTFLGGGTLPRVLEMPGLQAINVMSSGNEFTEFKEYKSRFLSQPSSNNSQANKDKSTEIPLIMNNKQGQIKTSKIVLSRDKVLKKSTSDRQFMDTQKLTLIKVKSEPFLNKNQKNVTSNLPPLHFNKNYFTETQSKSIPASIYDSDSHASASVKPNIRLISMPKIREASQRNQRLIKPINNNIQNSASRQQSAPMPPEALSKKRDEREFNNFVLEPTKLYHMHESPLPLPQKNNGILKVKLASINNASEPKLQKILEKNKFLSRIQESKQSSNHNHKSPKFKSKDKIIRLDQVPQLETSIKIDDHLNEIMVQNNQIQKLLMHSHSEQVLKPSILAKEDVTISYQTNQLVNEAKVPKFKVKPAPKKQLPAVAPKYEKHQLNMLTTFGPSQFAQKTSQLFQCKQKFPSNEGGDSHDEVEMTFGAITHANHFGCTLSNNSMRDSHCTNQTNQLFGQTFHKMLQESGSRFMTSGAIKAADANQ